MTSPIIVSQAPKTAHLRISEPSDWVKRFATLAKVPGRVLDLACGNGRHGRLFLELGHQVTFCDLNGDPLADLISNDRAEIEIIDLEDGKDWPFAHWAFDVIVVSNYLYRPHLPHLINSLTPNGMLIYETFARGNEEYSRPRNPDHLLECGELINLCAKRLQVVAYEHGKVERDTLPGVVQRICAINDLGSSPRGDGQPPVHKL